jgi:hypothetical protein
MNWCGKELQPAFVACSIYRVVLTGCASGALTTRTVRAAVRSECLGGTDVEGLQNEVAARELVLEYFGGALSARSAKITEKEHAIRTINDSVRAEGLSAGRAAATTAIATVSAFRILSHDMRWGIG